MRDGCSIHRWRRPTDRQPTAASQPLMTMMLMLLLLFLVVSKTLRSVVAAHGGGVGGGCGGVDVHYHTHNMGFNKMVSLAL